MPAFESACGIGVVITPEQIEEAVGKHKYCINVEMLIFSKSVFDVVICSMCFVITDMYVFEGRSCDREK